MNHTKLSDLTSERLSNLTISLLDQAPSPRGSSPGGRPLGAGGQSFNR